MSHSLSLVIINWNARSHLDRCLQSVLPLGHPTIVVDNASSDGSAAMAAERHPSAVVVASPVNLGFAGGVNAGVAKTQTTWVLVLNSDMTLAAGGLSAMLEAVDHDDGVGAAGACLVDEHGVPQAGFAVRRFPTLATLAVDLLLVDKVWPGNPVTSRYLARDIDLAVSQEVEQPAAACLLVRRAAFEQVGGFDARFHPAWFEDVDFCCRLRAAGWRIRYVAEARFRHEGGVALRSLGSKAFNEAWYGNMRRYVDRHLTPAARGVFRILMAVGMPLRALASVAMGRPDDARAYLAVLPGAFRDD